MINKWQEKTIEEIKDPSAYSIAMGPFGSNIKTDNFVPLGVPIIRGGNLNSNKFKDDNFVFLTDEKADELKSANAYPGDIVFTHRGTLGQVGIIPNSAKYKRYVVSQSQMKLRCNPELADPLFVFYFFKSPQGQHALLANTSTTGVPAISSPLTSLRAIRIPLPPLPEQRAIAEILGSLDDKIELNRRMNVTLEEMASTLFKHWFVDNPEAKRWEIGSISNLGNVITGKTPLTNNRENYNGHTLFITIPDMRGKIFITETGKTLSEQGVRTQAKKSLPPFSICVSCIATPGLVSITIKPSQTNQQINSLIPKDPHTSYFCYFVLRYLSDEIRSRGSGGSVIVNLNKAQFELLPVAIPPLDKIHNFQKMVDPLFMKHLSNEIESHTLRNLRDTLLPRLMRGEVKAA